MSANRTPPHDISGDWGGTPPDPIVAGLEARLAAAEKLRRTEYENWSVERDRRKRAEAEIRRLREELHSLRWLLGLETHKGEGSQSRANSHHNLDALLDKLAAVPEEDKSGND